MNNKNKIVANLQKTINKELRANGYKTKEQQSKVIDELLRSLSPSYKRVRTYHKNWIQARKDKGICVSCGEDAVKGKTRCEGCARKHSLANGKYLKARRMAQRGIATAH